MLLYTDGHNLLECVTQQACFLVLLLPIPELLCWCSWPKGSYVGEKSLYDDGEKGDLDTATASIDCTRVRRGDDSFGPESNFCDAMLYSNHMFYCFLDFLLSINIFHMIK